MRNQPTTDSPTADPQGTRRNPDSATRTHPAPPNEALDGKAKQRGLCGKLAQRVFCSISEIRRGWRDWRRGFTDQDAISAANRIMHRRPGEMVRLSQPEFRALLALDRRCGGRLLCVPLEILPDDGVPGRYQRPNPTRP